jgi:hypothetical protein
VDDFQRSGYAVDVATKYRTVISCVGDSGQLKDKNDSEPITLHSYVHVLYNFICTFNPQVNFFTSAVHLVFESLVIWTGNWTGLDRKNGPQ